MNKTDLIDFAKILANRTYYSDVIQRAFITGNKDYFYWQCITDHVLRVQHKQSGGCLKFLIPIIKDFCYAKYEEARKVIG